MRRREIFISVKEEYVCHSFTVSQLLLSTMDCMQQTTDASDLPQLRYVNFELNENHTLHDTRGLSKKQLVVRRGKPFKITLMFSGQQWNPHTQDLVLEVCLGQMSERIPVWFSDKPSNPAYWSANVYKGDTHHQSVTIHICSPVLSSVAQHTLLLHMENNRCICSFLLGSFVLLFNPWLRDDPVYMPHEIQRQEYVKNDQGFLFMGTCHNVRRRFWSFGQYEPKVLKACLKLLEVSPNHMANKHKDYTLRADPVYISRVVCAMVNSQDDKGILEGKWSGSYEDGVSPVEWSNSADILHHWLSSGCSPVRYGQCWVFASVLCTVMRVLGIPSRVVTVFNAAHDTDANVTIEEFYSTKGEKLNFSKDSIWNFHVWVECWMRRPDLNQQFDGWQVVDPTPQERSNGIFRCGPCPVAAIHQRLLSIMYDTPFLYSSVNGDVVRLTVHNGLVLQRQVDTLTVGKLIYTKSIDTDQPEDLTPAYKNETDWMKKITFEAHQTYSCSALEFNAEEKQQERTSSSLKVSLTIDGLPSVGENIPLRVTVTNQSNMPRILKEHVNAQVKEYNCNPRESFWKTQQKVHIHPREVLILSHIISPSEYQSVLGADDIVNFAVVIRDAATREHVMDAQEFNINSPPINIEIEGGDTVQVNKEHVAHVSFTSKFDKALTLALLTVEGCGLLQGKHEASLFLLQPGEKIEKRVSIMATSPGTKVLKATFSHSNSHIIISRIFHKVLVAAAS